ncbi:MAG TPA: hypothetical protein VIP07_08880 [Candidatus Limnocylindria bacterium]
MGARIYALVMLALVSAVLLMLTLTSGATFTAPTANPSNQVATATLAAPTGVSATVQSNGGTVRVAWTATSSIWASGHRVFRATSAAGPFSQIQQIAGRATVSYDDVPGVGTFFYVVRGYYNANGANWESVNSAQVAAKPLDHFTFNAITAQHSGSAFSFTVIARAQDNSTVTGFSGTVTLSVSSGAIAPASAAMTNGSLTQSVTITGAYTTSETIIVIAGTPARTGASAAFTLNHFRATAIALTNGGGTAGRIQNTDTIAITFSEAANTASLGTCGVGNSGNDISSNDANPDTITANGAALALGTLALGDNGYLSGADTAKNSTCAWSVGNTVITITLAGVTPGKTGSVAGGSTATYLPNAALTSAAGEAIDTTRTPSVTGVLF